MTSLPKPDREEFMRCAGLALDAMAQIRSQRLEHPDGGSIDCPQCNGVLRFRFVGMRFHIRAKCETAGCLELIE